MDDNADLAMLTSPNRVSHRRVRSDPSEFLRSLARADTFGVDVEVEATGKVQAVEADETGAQPLGLIGEQRRRGRAC